MEEVVGAFVTARPVALEIATKDKKDKEEVSQRPSKRRRTERNSGGASEVTVRTTRSRGKRTTQNDQAAVYDGAADDGSDAEYTEPSNTQPERQQTPDDGLVACPICQTRMKEETVFGHIGTSACTSPSQQRKRQQSKPPAPQAPRATSNVILPDRLTELNYSLLNEKALRKKLSELGIPSTGSKALLSRRHTEYVNLWNANVDAGAPRSKRELLAELAKWDRSIGRDYADGAGGGIGGGAGAQVMKKDFDAKAWEKGNKDDFARLIAEARKGRNKATPKPDSSTAESTADDQPKQTQPQQPDPMAIDPAPPAKVNPELDLPQGYHNATTPQENFPSVDHPPPSGQRVTPPPLPSKETSLPEKFGAEGGQTINMFEVSSHPVADIETMQEGGQEGR